ncbi:MAG: DUF4173 domain-containing protein [Oscillospiraceae bacterium]|nr:DUF4173 domain-containing protein [Oscillospiraceae bacterium]
MNENGSFPVNPPAPRRVRTEWDATKTGDLVLAVLMAVLGVLLMDAIFFTGLNLGAGICLFLMGICTAVYLFPARRDLHVYGLFCRAVMLALAVSFLFSDDSGLKFLSLLAIVIYGSIAPLELLAQRRYEAGTTRSVMDLCRLIFACSFGKIGVGCMALFHKERNGSIEKRRIGAVLIGLCCAIPALMIVVPLLISSDAAFESLVTRLRVEDMGRHIASLMFGLFLALLLFCQHFYLRIREPVGEAGERSFRGVEPLIVGSFLGAICLVYAVYLISQGAYFFDGFRSLLPAGYTPAMYARRGFFEMCGLCVLNLTFLFLAALLCRRTGDRLPLSIRLMLLFLCLFSLTLTAISVSKLVLYIRSFGMTRLRILTTGFDLVMASLLIALALRLFVRKIPYLKIAAVTGAVVLLTLSFANVDRVVARYNARAYQNGTLSSIDMKTMDKLSDAAVPYLVELAEDEDPQVAATARNQLRGRAVDLFLIVDGRPAEPRKTDWRAWNAVTAEARRMLLKNWDRLELENPPQKDR